jgi:hypothetical protein
MDYDLANWIVSILALILAGISIYFQHLKRGKLICKLERHSQPVIDLNLEREVCKFGITLIFENNQKKDWVITYLSLEYRFLNKSDFGIHSDANQLMRDKHTIRIPAGETHSENFEITLPLKNLEYWICSSSSNNKRIDSNIETHYPFTHVIPYWIPFYKNNESFKNLLLYIKNKCPIEDQPMCLDMVNFFYREYR